MTNLKLISDQCRLLGFLIGCIEALHWQIEDEEIRARAEFIIEKVKKESQEIMERIQYE